MENYVKLRDGWKGILGDYFIARGAIMQLPTLPDCDGRPCFPKGLATDPTVNNIKDIVEVCSFLTRYSAAGLVNYLPEIYTLLQNCLVVAKHQRAILRTEFEACTVRKIRDVLNEYVRIGSEHPLMAPKTVNGYPLAAKVTTHIGPQWANLVWYTIRSVGHITNDESFGHLLTYALACDIKKFWLITHSMKVTKMCNAVVLSDSKLLILFMICNAAATVYAVCEQLDAPEADEARVTDESDKSDESDESDE